MAYINFSRNWNGKLDLPIFTTIRKEDPQRGKFKFYGSKVGRTFSVNLNGTKYCEARLIHIDLAYFHEIPTALRLMDTGEQDHKAIFEKFNIGEWDKVIVLAFARTDALRKRGSLGGFL